MPVCELVPLSQTLAQLLGYGQMVGIALIFFGERVRARGEVAPCPTAK